MGTHSASPAQSGTKADSAKQSEDACAKAPPSIRAEVAEAPLSIRAEVAEASLSIRVEVAEEPLSIRVEVAEAPLSIRAEVAEAAFSPLHSLFPALSYRAAAQSYVSRMSLAMLETNKWPCAGAGHSGARSG